MVWECDSDIRRPAKEVHGAPVAQEGTVQTAGGVFDGKRWVKVDVTGRIG